VTALKRPRAGCGERRMSSPSGGTSERNLGNGNRSCPVPLSRAG
jgi:hypothetical protein